MVQTPTPTRPALDRQTYEAGVLRLVLVVCEALAARTAAQ